jgi:hypothetical protein
VLSQESGAVYFIEAVERLLLRRRWCPGSA